ncbi:unnamed protein product, partial [Closterium sp. NIES-53]
VLRFDAEGRALEFSTLLFHAQLHRSSQRHDNNTLFAHTLGDLPAPLRPTPLSVEPTAVEWETFSRRRWEYCNTAARLVLSYLLPPTEAVHFSQVTSEECFDIIVSCYPTPSASHGHLLVQFFFPYLVRFTLTSLDTSNRAVRSNTQLASHPPPLFATLYFNVTRLPDRLSSARGALLREHPTALTIRLIETILNNIEGNLCPVASATGGIVSHLFEGAREARREGKVAEVGGGGTGASGGGGSGGVADTEGTTPGGAGPRGVAGTQQQPQQQHP